MLKIAASLADGIPVDLRDTLTSLDQRNVGLVVTAVQHAARQTPVSVCLGTPDAEDLADFLWFLSEWLTCDPEQLGDSLARLMGSHPYGIDMLRHDISRVRALLSDENNNGAF